MSISVNYILEQEKLKKEQEQSIESPKTALHDRVMAKSQLQTNYEQGQKVSQQVQEAPKPQRIAGFESYDDGQYEAMSTFMSPTQMQAIASQDPNAFLDSTHQRIYENSARKPIDPYQNKDYRRQNKFAAIGDALGLASQVAGAAMGAHPRERKFEESAMGRLSARQQQLYNRYLQESDQYSRGLVNANMQDYLQGKTDWKEAQRVMREALSTHEKNEIYKAKEAQRINEFDIRTKQQDERIRIMEDQQAQRNETSKQREDRLRAASNKPKAEKEEKPAKAEAHIVLPAHKDDTEATEDQFGSKTVSIGMTKGQKEDYARKAIANTDFMQRHPEFALDGYTKKAHTATDLNNIAAAYVGELYNAQFDNAAYNASKPNIAPKPNPAPATKKADPNTNHSQVDDEFQIVN